MSEEKIPYQHEGARFDPIDRAFPSNAVNPEFRGMSLVDWFAGQALAGLLQDGRSYPAEPGPAVVAYRIAYAMMAERERRRID